MLQNSSRPSETTKRKILAACGNQCARPDCEELIFDLNHQTILGDIAHIKGRRPESPRYDNTQTDDERNSFSNLIALCSKHHKLIDDNPERYPAELLFKWKTEHEEKIVNQSDRNWIAWPTAVVMSESGYSISAYYWIDRNRRPRIYSQEQLAVCNTLIDLSLFSHSLNTLLSTIDQIKDESQIQWLKQEVKKLKLNEYGFIGTLHEMFQIAQNVTFGEFNIFQSKGGRKNKEKLYKDGQDRLKAKIERLPENPRIEKISPKE